MLASAHWRKVEVTIINELVQKKKVVSTKVLSQRFEKLVKTWSKLGQNLVKAWSGLVKPWSQGAGPFGRMVAGAFSWNGLA